MGKQVLKTATTLLSTILLSSCQGEVERPASVPIGAKYNPSGSHSWSYCENKDIVDQYPLYKCSYYNSYGKVIWGGYYLDLNKFNSLFDKLQLGVGNTVWWQGKKLVLFYKYKKSYRPKIKDGEVLPGNIVNHRFDFLLQDCFRTLQDDEIVGLKIDGDSDVIQFQKTWVPEYFRESFNEKTSKFVMPDKLNVSRKCWVRVIYN